MLRRCVFLLLLALADAAAAQPAAAPPADWLRATGATAEAVDEPVLGGRVVVYRAGRRGAEPVVLVHGLGQNGARDWSGLIPALADRFEVFALDLPGFGQSDKGNRLYSPENFARAIDAALGPRIAQPFALIGHSMGGAVALAYTAAYPQRVRRLVLVDMAGVLHRSIYAEFLTRLGAQSLTGLNTDGAPWFDQLVRSVLTRAEGAPLGPELILQAPPLRQKLLRGDPNAIAAFALVQHDFSRALREVKTPTLLVWGREDRIAPLRTGRLAAATIPGARLAVIDGIGHSPQLQAPQRFNEIVLSELLGQLQLPPYALTPGAGELANSAVCENRSGQHYTGEFRQLTLARCTGVEITNARIGRLVVTDSDVRIVNSEIRDGVDARNSRLEFTAGRVSGTPALVLDATPVDAAGTRFEGPGSIAANRGAVPLVLHLSVAETARGDAREYQHGLVRLAPEHSW